MGMNIELLSAGKMHFHFIFSISFERQLFNVQHSQSAMESQKKRKQFIRLFLFADHQIRKMLLFYAKSAMKMNDERELHWDVRRTCIIFFMI